MTHSLGKPAPFFLDQAPRFTRNGIRFLPVKLGGAAFENDLLLVRAAQSEPAQTDARQDDGEEKYPDASFHEARRKLATFSFAEQQSASVFLKIAQRFNAGKIM